MITLPKDASHWQQQLLILDELVTLDKAGVAARELCLHLPQRKVTAKGTIEVEHAECRLTKCRSPDGAVAKPGNDSEIKRQSTYHTQKNQCLVTVKLIHQITSSNPTVTLEHKMSTSICIHWRQAL